MRKKALGKIYIIVGIYLLIIHPIYPLIFTQVYSIIFSIPLDPLANWFEWLMMFGWFVILLAGIGVYLIKIGYRIIKSTKVVITGSTLEEHLRKLCIKNGIDIEVMSHGKMRPKKADLMNSEIAKNGIYNKLEQKSVTAWLDLRNKAAHGKYNEYNDNQVKQMIMGVRDFITRNPA